MQTGGKGDSGRYKCYDRKYKLYEFFKNGSRSVQEWAELSSSKIGESPIEGNTEVIEEIKESSTPYSIENEPNE